ncbi:MAG: hypothetical protein OXC26_08500 [Albidovulum sp.]|nr:hypothetical protein [Albidovulum sp.]
MTQFLRRLESLYTQFATKSRQLGRIEFSARAARLEYLGIALNVPVRGA